MVKRLAMRLLNYNFKQPSDWTCGPAVARIILNYYGTNKSIRQLVRELRATRHGTSNGSIRNLLRRHDIKFYEHQNTSLKKMKKCLQKNIVLVAYWIPRHKESHYSIVKKITREQINFHDTWFGSSHSYSLPYFEKNWRDDEANRWMLTVKK